MARAQEPRAILSNILRPCLTYRLVGLGLCRMFTYYAHIVLNSVPSTIETGCGGTSCIPSTREARAGGSEVQGCAPLHREFKPAVEWTWPINSIQKILNHRIRWRVTDEAEAVRKDKPDNVICFIRGS